MPPRWGVRLLAAGVLALVTVAPSVPELVVSTESGPGNEIARLPLTEGKFAMRYRNSLYGSAVEERYSVVDDEFRLDTLLAEELGVLEEYYGARAQSSGDSWPWSAPPPNEVETSRLHVAATDLGRRELEVAPNVSIELWQLVSDEDPTVTLTLETR